MIALLDPTNPCLVRHRWGAANPIASDENRRHYTPSHQPPTMP
jgi:hypothetical protein